MRLIVHGQQAYGQAVLEAILEKGVDEVVAVYCAPDKEGRPLDPIKEYALEHGLPVHPPGAASAAICPAGLQDRHRHPDHFPATPVGDHWNPRIAHLLYHSRRPDGTRTGIDPRRTYDFERLPVCDHGLRTVELDRPGGFQPFNSHAVEPAPPVS